MSSRSSQLSPSLSFLLLLVALLTLTRFPLVSAQSSPPVNLTILSASGDGDCVNVGGVALNCTLPLTLNLTVVSLPIPVPDYALELVFNASAWVTVDYFRATYAPTFIAISISSQRFHLPGSTVLNAFLRWKPLVNRTRVEQDWGQAPVLSLRPWNFPTVTAVSGCEETGQALLTTNCVPEQDVLTITGSGFAQLDAAGLVTSGVNITTIEKTLYFAFTRGVKLVNDTTITVALTDALGFLLLAEHYSGDVLQMRLQEYYTAGIWQTSFFFITMAFLPPPQVSRYQVYGVPAISNGSITSYLTCIPGQSLLNVEGKYLFNPSVTVGGFVCSTNRAESLYNRASPTELQCTLDDGDALTPAMAYDVVITTDEGRVVIPQAIGFTAQPTLSHVLPCWDDGGFYPRFGFPVPRCMVGDTLTIVGNRLLRSQAQVSRVSFVTYYAPPAPYLNCSNPQVTSDTTITCVLPPNRNPDYIMSSAQLMSQWGDYATNSFMTYPYDFLDAPRILAITGCGMTANNSQALFLTACQPGDVLQLSGYNLDVTGGALIRSISHVSTNYSVFACANVMVWNKSMVTCNLPSLDEFPQLLNNSQYNVTISRASRIVGGGIEFSSNYFGVSFGDAPAPAPEPVSPPDESEGSSGGASETVAVAVSVVVVVVVALLAAMGWWVWRRKMRGKSDADSNGEKFSQLSSHKFSRGIELADK